MNYFNVNDETFSKYKTYFLSRKPKWNGWNSIVTEYDEFRVIKFSHTKHDGFRLYGELNDAERNRFGLPKMELYDVITDDNIYLIERLYPVDWDFWDDIKEYNWEETNHLVRDWLWGYVKSENKRKEKKKLLDNVLNNYAEQGGTENHPFRDMLIKACNLVIYFATKNKMVGLDINNTNIMSREDGELIWSDVLGSYNPYSNIYSI